MDLSKLEAGKLNVHPQSTQLYPLCHQLIETYQTIIRQKNILLQWDYQLPQQAAVLIDRNKFQKILHNLLSNAFKYTPENGEVFVLVEQVDDQYFSVEVSDNGRGIHPNDLPHIFDRFYQSEQADTPKEGGTGIGLAFVKELTHLMEGKIEVKSELGKGSSFKFMLPLAYADETYLQQTKEVEEAWAFPLSKAVMALETFEVPEFTTKPSVLVVEDHHQMRAFIIKCLEAKYQILAVQNGEEALDLLKKQKVDLILSDLMMPKMDGYQLLKQLKTDQQTKFIPTIMLTARADMEDKLKALAIGVNEYMLKPFHPTELRIRIRNLIYLSQERQKATLHKNKVAAKTNDHNADYELVDQAKKHVLANLANSNYGVVDLAEATALSQRSLARKIKGTTGLSPLQFINEIRLQEARRMLESGLKTTIAEVMYEVGYRTGGHFSRNFQKRFGITPSKYLEASLT